MTHVKLGGEEEGHGPDELHVVPGHLGHAGEVGVHDLHRQVQCLVVQLKVLLHLKSEQQLNTAQMHLQPQTNNVNIQQHKCQQPTFPATSVHLTT